jgi:hypothetical protein
MSSDFPPPTPGVLNHYYRIADDPRNELCEAAQRWLITNGFPYPRPPAPPEIDDDEKEDEIRDIFSGYYDYTEEIPPALIPTICTLLSAFTK